MEQHSVAYNNNNHNTHCRLETVKTALKCGTSQLKAWVKRNVLAWYLNGKVGIQQATKGWAF